MCNRSHDGCGWVLYCIRYTYDKLKNPYTYVGITNNLKRRLRQHNGALVGGARYTRIIRKRHPGYRWRRLFVIDGFPSDRVVRQWEWRLHRKTRYSRCTICNRYKAFLNATQLERVTQSAPLNSELKLRVRWYARCQHIASLKLHS